MDRKFIASCALMGTVALGACAMTETQQRTATGAALGGVAAGVISGEWGWAAAGAVAGAAGGYLYDQNKKAQEEAYKRGVQDGQKQK